MKYTQLTLTKRYHISTLIKEGYNQKEIANEIGVHPSTICREFQKFRAINKSTYSAESMQIEAKKNHIYKPKRSAMTNVIEKYVRQSLKKDWSPEQLVGRMKIDINQTISHETIYQFIYANKAHGGVLYKYLRHKNKKYHKRTNEYQRRGIIKNRISIDERPTIVDAKVRIGDWEIDTVIGKDHKGALVTLVDRKSKFAIIRRVKSKHADVVTEATIELLQPLKKFTHTITADNGKEFAYHELIAKALDAKVYFCDPYSSWQRGLNEHTNGLIRQYIPKKSEFENISKEEIVTIQNKLNHRPRKSLGFKTPFEVFMKEFSKEMAA
jgi:IS30 family transposase